MSTQKKPDRAQGNDTPLEGTATQSWKSHCCYSHDWPYFRDPVHPYDYSGDWSLEKEWEERADGKSR